MSRQRRKASSRHVGIRSSRCGSQWPRFGWNESLSLEARRSGATNRLVGSGSVVCGSQWPRLVWSQPVRKQPVGSQSLSMQLIISTAGKHQSLVIEHEWIELVEHRPLDCGSHIIEPLIGDHGWSGSATSDERNRPVGSRSSRSRSLSSRLLGHQVCKDQPLSMQSLGSQSLQHQFVLN